MRSAPRTSATCCFASATGPTRSSRSSRARSRSSTPPATRSSATAPSRFLGELNLLSGQTVFLTAVATEPLRYIAVDRDVLRPLLFEDGPLSDLLLVDVHRPARGAAAGARASASRSSARTRRRRPCACSTSPGATGCRTPGATRERRSEVAALVTASTRQLPLVRLPGGAELHGPSTGEVSRALGIGRELAPREEVDLLVVGAGPGGPRRRRLRRVRGPRHARHRRAPRSAGRRARPGGSRTTSASRPGSAAPS